MQKDVFILLEEQDFISIIPNYIMVIRFIIAVGVLRHGSGVARTIKVMWSEIVKTMCFGVFFLSFSKKTTFVMTE